MTKGVVSVRVVGRVVGLFLARANASKAKCKAETYACNL